LTDFQSSENPISLLTFLGKFFKMKNADFRRKVSSKLPCLSAIESRWKRIEVVITGLTRNQVDRKVSWVRIPPLPPQKSSNHAGLLDFSFCFYPLSAPLFIIFSVLEQPVFALEQLIYPRNLGLNSLLNPQQRL
jgi:hypothetical protein